MGNVPREQVQRVAFAAWQWVRACAARRTDSFRTGGEGTSLRTKRASAAQAGAVRTPWPREGLARSFRLFAAVAENAPGWGV